jgi:hypothetical protein
MTIVILFVDAIDDLSHWITMFIRRLGIEKGATQACSGGRSCPDIIELADGDYAVIGADISRHADQLSAVGAGCGPGETMVRIPRAILVRARADIPTTP